MTTGRRRFVHYSTSDGADFVLDATKIDANAERPGLFVYPIEYETRGWPGRFRIEIEVPADAAEPFQSFEPGELEDAPDGLEEWFIPAERFGDIKIL